MSYLQGFFISRCISWESNLLFLLDFPWIFCAVRKWNFSEFLWWGVSVYLTWAKMNCFTCCHCLFLEISCFCYLSDITKLTRISTFIALGWLHVVDTPRAYVIIKLTFFDRNLGTEPCIDCFWLRTAFLAFATNSSGLHSGVVATSDICFWVSSRSEVLALGVRRKSTE